MSAWDYFHRGLEVVLLFTYASILIASKHSVRFWRFPSVKDRVGSPSAPPHFAERTSPNTAELPHLVLNRGRFAKCCLWFSFQSWPNVNVFQVSLVGDETLIRFLVFPNRLRKSPHSCIPWSIRTKEESADSSSFPFCKVCTDAIFVIRQITETSIEYNRPALSICKRHSTEYS